MSDASVLTRSRGLHILLGVSLILIAFNLRPVFSSLAAVLPEVMRTMGISAAVASLMTTLPVLCLGLFAPLAPRVANRIGIERCILVFLLILTVGTALRGFATLPALLIGSVLAGASIAVVNVLLPSLVKRDFPTHSAMMTGLYTMALCAGAASAAGLTAPLRIWLGDSWPAALAFWALPALAILLLWLPQALRTDRLGQRRGPQVRGLLRDPLAWQVTFFMGLQSAYAYCVFGWLAPILRERGMDAVAAGGVVSLSLIVQMAACLVMPSIAIRGRDQRLMNVSLVLIAFAGLLGCLYAPVSTAWFWGVVQGVGQGGLISVALTVIILRSPDVNVAAHLSGMAQGVGYMLASLGPLAVGYLREISGGFAITGWLFAAIAVVNVLMGWGAGRHQFVKVQTVAR